MGISTDYAEIARERLRVEASKSEGGLFDEAVPAVALPVPEIINGNGTYSEIVVPALFDMEVEQG
jgi:hypothetical protein